MKAWEEFLDRLEQELGVETVKKWLRSLKVLRFDACNLYLEAKDTFQLLWFEEHVRSKAVGSLVNNNHRKIRVHLSLGSKAIPDKGPIKERETKKQPLASPQPQFDQLDPSCTFAHFVAGEPHQFILQIFQHQLYTFNPIYLHGTSGSGKTHLLMALAKEQIELGKKVIYVRSETFTDHVVAAIRSGDMSTFRNAYRHVDLLLIDDIHFLSRKNATQEELFHTFNTLHLMQKQMVFAANCLPQDLKEIEPRLVSRFEWGISTSIEPFKGHGMVPVLMQKAKALDFPLSPKLSQFIIESFASGPKAMIRALEALILRSHVQNDKKISYRQMTVALAQHYLADLLLAERQAAMTPEKIIRYSSDHYGLRPEDILGKAQTRECTLPRQIAMFLCRHHLKLPFKQIGTIFERDHSTVMTSIGLIKKEMEKSQSDIAAAVSAIEKLMHK
jgi:chromosomal replication initiator protein